MVLILGGWKVYEKEIKDLLNISGIDYIFVNEFFFRRETRNV